MFRTLNYIFDIKRQRLEAQRRHREARATLRRQTIARELEIEWRRPKVIDYNGIDIAIGDIVIFLAANLKGTEEPTDLDYEILYYGRIRNIFYNTNQILAQFRHTDGNFYNFTLYCNEVRVIFDTIDRTALPLPVGPWRQQSIFH